MQARLPYSIITKLISLPGLLRFELNRVLNFSNIKEETFDSIYRRSMVIRLQATFTPKIEYEKLEKAKASELGIFPRDDSIRCFLPSKADGAAFLRILLSFMRHNTARECQDRIDTYARYEGATESVMRNACGLYGDPPAKIQPFAKFDPIHEEMSERRKISDSLATVAIMSNAEVHLGNVHELWNLLPRENNVGKTPRKGHIAQEFERMIKCGLWVRRGTSYRGHPCFSPVIRPRCSASILFGEGEPETVYKYREIINVNALRL